LEKYSYLFPSDYRVNRAPPILASSYSVGYGYNYSFQFDCPLIPNPIITATRSTVSERQHLQQHLQEIIFLLKDLILNIKI